MSAKELVEKYTDSLPLRILLQQIPYIGGALDTMKTDFDIIYTLGQLL